MNSIISYLKKGGLSFICLAVALILNNRLGYITIIGVFSIIVTTRFIKKARFDNSAIILLAYVILYILLSSLNRVSYSTSTLVLYAVAPCIFYQYSHHIVTQYRSENDIITAWLIIIFCYCLDIYATIFNNIIETRQIINIGRDFYFSDNSSFQLSATLVGLPMDIGMIGLPMAILCKQNTLRFSFLLLFLFSLTTTFSLLNRTGIVVAILCCALVIGYKARKDFRLLVLTLLSISLIIGLLIYSGIINTELLDYYNARNEDLSTLGTRTERWVEALKNLIIYPLGWAKYGQTYYVHNMWLDVARISGIVPFILLAYIAFDSFRKAFRLIKRSESTLSYMILGLNICFFASCFVEPIYGGTHFMLYCMLWGTSNALLKKNKR